MKNKLTIDHIESFAEQSKTYNRVLKHRNKCVSWANNFCIECFGGGLATFTLNLDKERQAKRKIIKLTKSQIKDFKVDDKTIDDTLLHKIPLSYIELYILQKCFDDCFVEIEDDDSTTYYLAKYPNMIDGAYTDEYTSYCIPLLDKKLNKYIRILAKLKRKIKNRG